MPALGFCSSCLSMSVTNGVWGEGWKRISAVFIQTKILLMWSLKNTAHLETFLPLWNVFVLFWNVFETECVKLKSSIHVAYLCSEIRDILLVLLKFLSKMQNKLKICTWSGMTFSWVKLAFLPREPYHHLCQGIDFMAVGVKKRESHVAVIFSFSEIPS